MLKRILSVVLFLALILSLFSCGEREFRASELVLPLPRNFKELDEGGNSADLLVGDGVLTLSVTRLSFMNADVPPSLSAEEFAKYFISQTHKDATLSFFGDLPYYTYRYDSEGVELLCTAAFIASPYAYFLLLFSHPVSYEAEYRERILEYADGAYFDLNVN